MRLRNHAHRFLGWNQEKHELISVIDNQQFYSPWTASVVLKDFSYFDHFFFEDSVSEIRHSVEDNSDFKIYPVVGMCGNRQLKMNEMGFKDATSFLQVCAGARAKNALVIYLYKSVGGGEAPLRFNSSGKYPFCVYHSWLSTRLCFALGIALIIFLLYRFAARPKRAARK